MFEYQLQSLNCQMDPSTPPKRFDIQSESSNILSLWSKKDLIRTPMQFASQHRVGRETSQTSSIAMEKRKQRIQKNSFMRMQEQLREKEVDQHLKQVSQFSGLVTQLLEAQKNYSLGFSNFKANQTPKINSKLLVSKKTNTKNMAVLRQLDSIRANGGQDNNKIKYYYKNGKQENQYEYIPQTNIKKFKIFSKEYFTFCSTFPQPVRELYQSYKQRYQGKQINFVQGYLSNADIIYYAIENNLILHWPAGPATGHNNKQDCCKEVRLRSFLGNIIQTKRKLSSTCFLSRSNPSQQQQNGEIVIMCYPNQIELGYLNYNRAGKLFLCSQLQMLNIQHRLPNYWQPSKLVMVGNCIYYMGDDETLHLSQLNLQTTEIKKITLVEAKANKKQIKQEMKEQQERVAKYSIFESLKQTARQNNSLQKMRAKLGNYLASKVTHSLLYPEQSDWIKKLNPIQCTKTIIHQMIPCECPHAQIIVCIMQIKLSGPVLKFINKTNKQQLTSRKILRIYTKYTNNLYWQYQQIQLNMKQQIINANIQTKYEQCKCKSIIKLNTYNRKQNKYLCQYYNINYDQLLRKQQQTRQQHNIIYETQIEDQDRIIQQFYEQNNKYEILKYRNTTQILVIDKQNNKNSYRLCSNDLQVQTKYQNIYVEEVGNNKIITVCTDKGYTRFVQVNPIDSVYSLLKYYVSANKKYLYEANEQISKQIQKMSEFILLNIVHHHQKQNKSANTVQIQIICQLITNIIMLITMACPQPTQIYQTKVKYIQQTEDGVYFSINQVSPTIAKYATKVIQYYNHSLLQLLNKYQIKLVSQDNKICNFQSLQQLCNVINNKQIQVDKGQQQNSSLIKQNIDKNKNSQQNNQNIVQLSQYQLKSQQQSQKLIKSIFIKPYCSTSMQFIMEYAVAKNLQFILSPFWNQLIVRITEDKYKIITQKLNAIQEVLKLNKVKISQTQIRSPIANDVRNMQQKQSPSTLANSNYTNESVQIKAQISYIRKIQQIFSVTHLINWDLENKLTLKQVFAINCYQFAPTLFQTFTKDYEEGSLNLWKKAIPDYVNAKDGLQLPHWMKKNVEIKDLHYWLALYENIKSIKQKIDVVKKIKIQTENASLVDENKILNMLKDSNIQTNLDKTTQKYRQQIQQKCIVVPNFFLKYLLNERKIILEDFKYFKQQNNAIKSQFEGHFNRINMLNYDLKPNYFYKQQNYVNQSKSRIRQVQSIQIKSEQRNVVGNRKRQIGIQIEQIIRSHKN